MINLLLKNQSNSDESIKHWRIIQLLKDQSKFQSPISTTSKNSRVSEIIIIIWKSEKADYLVVLYLKKGHDQFTRYPLNLRLNKTDGDILVSLILNIFNCGFSVKVTCVFLNRRKRHFIRNIRKGVKGIFVNLASQISNLASQISNLKLGDHLNNWQKGLY